MNKQKINKNFKAKIITMITIGLGTVLVASTSYADCTNLPTGVSIQPTGTYKFTGEPSPVALYSLVGLYYALKTDNTVVAQLLIDGSQVDQGIWALDPSTGYLSLSGFATIPKSTFEAFECGSGTANAGVVQTMRGIEANDDVSLIRVSK